MEKDALVEVYSVTDPNLAEVIRLGLENQGIPCQIGNEHQAGLTGILRVPLLVRSEDRERAQQIILKTTEPDVEDVHNKPEQAESAQENKPAGSINWFDLTVSDASQLRDFYASVVGWKHSEVDMGEYADFCMNQPENGKTVAGICHAKGVNADLPPVWLMYINVEDLEESLEKCLAQGGSQVSEIRSAGGGKYCVVKDPAGAAFALYEP